MLRISSFSFVLFFITLFQFSVSSIVWSSDKKIIIATDEWCPYTCANQNMPGFLIEAAKQIFEKKGYKVEVNFMPWERAKVTVLNGEAQGAAGLDEASAKTTESKYKSKKKFLFPKTISYMQKNMIWVKSENQSALTKKIAEKYPDISKFVKPFTIQNVEFLLENINGQIGLILGYEYDLQASIKKANRAYFSSGESPLTSLITSLNRGNLGALVEDEAVVIDTCKRLGLQNKLSPIALEEASTPIHIGFCPSCHTENDIYDKGLAELKQNGEFTKILNKYGLK